MKQTQRTLFDSKRAELVKRRGMTMAAEHRVDVLEKARAIAELRGLTGAHVTIDDVQAELIEQEIDPKMLGNAAGSVFKGGEWEMVGYQLSERVSRHKGLIRVWRLKNKNQRALFPMKGEER